MSKDLRVSAMQDTYSGIVSLNNTIQLPSDCREVLALRVTDSGLQRELKPLPPSQLATTSCVRLGYVTRGRMLQCVGGTDQPNFYLEYLKAIPALADAPLQMNWLIQREPGVYLYAALLEASPYLQDDSRALVWAQQYGDIVEKMNAEEAGLRYGNAPAQVFGGP